MSLSESQANALTWIPRFTTPLSIIGSSCILFLILRKTKSKLSTSYNRILFALSSVDILTSFWFVLGSVLAPSDTSNGKGSIATCNAQGFFLQYGIIVNLSYSSSLMVYFYQTICAGLSPERFAKQWEPWIHVISFVLPFSLAIVLIPLEKYNWTGGSHCGIAASPPGCEAIPQLTCQRGAPVAPFVWGFQVVPIMLSLLVYYSSILWVYWKVRITSRKTQRSSLRNVTTKTEKRVATQCVLYGVTFVNTFLWNLIVDIIFALGRYDLFATIYPVLVLVTIFHPMQGFFNLLIFVRPRYLRIRDANPSKQRLWALLRSITCSDLSRSIRSEQHEPGGHGAFPVAEETAKADLEEQKGAPETSK